MSVLEDRLVVVLECCPPQLLPWKQILVIVVLCGLGSGIWYLRDRTIDLTGGFFGKEEQSRKRHGHDSSVPVIVEPVRLTKAIDKIQAIGDGLANRSITVYPQASGIISQLAFKAGQRVKAGDVIVKLDDVQAQITVRIAETKLAEARRTLKRNLSLLPQKAVAAATVDTARTAVKTAELELQQAREALADRSVIAPFDGVLGIPQVELGDRVSEATAIASLDDRSMIIVEFDVPEIYLNRLALGQRIDAMSAAFRDQHFGGKLTEIDSRINTTTRSVRVRAELPNRDDRLRPGMSFSVILTLEGNEYPTVAELALLWARDGAYVWRVTKGKAEKVKVSVVKRVAGQILVDGDLSERQFVVIEGTQRLRDGRKVLFDKPRTTSDDKAGP